MEWQDSDAKKGEFLDTAEQKTVERKEEKTQVDPLQGSREWETLALPYKGSDTLLHSWFNGKNREKKTH